jgi:carbamoyltransferase
MNVKLNQEIAKLDTVKELYVAASGGDESLCVGACYRAALVNNEASVNHFRNNYVGGNVPRSTLIRELADIRNSTLKEGIGYAEVAKLLAEGWVIGRFDGSMEFGARSLGNRSILADPRRADIIEKINRQIKFRDFWMPFAPSVLANYADRYLINPKKLSSDHMTLTFCTTDEGKTALRAALHPADGTVRAHIIFRENNPEYFSLVEAFASLTGVGALLNTSFNLHGFPIVAEPKHLRHVFENSELDAMIVEDILITRHN